MKPACVVLLIAGAIGVGQAAVSIIPPGPCECAVLVDLSPCLFCERRLENRIVGLLFSRESCARDWPRGRYGDIVGHTPWALNVRAPVEADAELTKAIDAIAKLEALKKSARDLDYAAEQEDMLNVEKTRLDSLVDGVSASAFAFS